ncbi:hypothetical protein DSO57_1034069 [Entomophthora muscae]|uniref:Uncharacterized protein n=1 Tax=Entomophthora muscae TaxID=34485 RepID=A0ACC2TAZ7_9FUNG|nr:hypothetical protein DSO57_1034069 [Entomophthora muscae]
MSRLVIYGPPGTGKTQTLVELVRQIVCTDKRVLVCGPSNTSVDNLLERISAHAVTCLRLGNPDRLKLQNLSQYLLDTKVKQIDSVCRIRKQMDRLRDEIALCKDSSLQDMKDNHLRQELRNEEQKATKDIIDKHKVICSTLSGAGSRVLNGQLFDVLIIDEATQALEPECWIAISHAKSVVLVGDHHQLPPVILCPGSGLEVTLFQRLFETLPHISRMLNTQYRMHQKIVGFSSLQLYEDKLESFESVKNHLLNQLPCITNTLSTSSPLIFVNTAGKGLRESHGAKSKSNSGEVNLAIKHLQNLLKCGLDASSIAIISPTTPKSTSCAMS